MVKINSGKDNTFEHNAGLLILWEHSTLFAPEMGAHCIVPCPLHICVSTRAHNGKIVLHLHPYDLFGICVDC